MALNIGGAAVADVRIGAGQAVAVYAGAEKVWPNNLYPPLTYSAGQYSVSEVHSNSGECHAQGPEATGRIRISNIDMNGADQTSFWTSILGTGLSIPLTITVDSGPSTYVGTITRVARFDLHDGTAFIDTAGIFQTAAEWNSKYAGHLLTLTIG